MTGPKFEMTLNLGHILIVIGMIGSVSMAYSGVMVRLENHEQRLESVERDNRTNDAISREILSTLTTIREDIAALKAQQNRSSRNR